VHSTRQKSIPLLKDFGTLSELGELGAKSSSGYSRKDELRIKCTGNEEENETGACTM
jgi:hypothetical protein